ncbi:MAG: PilZ domain-containing protein [Oceanidesulfovibrio sp.]
MADKPPCDENSNVRCPTCGDIFTVKIGLMEASRAARAERGEIDRRGEPRVLPLAVRILLEESLRELPVHDLTHQGLGIEHLGWRFEKGQYITFDLIQGYRIILKGVRGEVVRVDNTLIGVTFLNVIREQMDEVYDKIEETEESR